LHENLIDAQSLPTRMEQTSLQAGQACMRKVVPHVCLARAGLAMWHATCMHAWTCIHQSTIPREYFLLS